MGNLAALSALLALLAEQTWAQSVEFDDLSAPAPFSFFTQQVFYIDGEHGQASVTFELQQQKQGQHSDREDASYAGLQVHILPQMNFGDMIEKAHFCEDRKFKFKRKGRSVSYSITGKSNVQKSDIKEASGAYALILSNCAETSTDIKVRGKVSVRNPHGYLPAIDYPKRTLYGIFALLYTGTSVFWAILGHPWKSHLYFMQKGIALVNVMGAVECIVFFFLYEVWNRTGDWSHALFLVAALSSVYKAMVCFRVVLVSAIADDPLYTDEDGPSASLFVQALMAVHMMADFNYRMVQADKMGKVLSFQQVLMRSVPMILFGTVIFVWTFMALNSLVLRLEERKEKSQARLFWHSLLLVALSAAGGVLVVAAQLLDPTGADASTWSGHWLYADGYRQGVFFLLLCGLMAIWRPREEIQGYTYAGIVDVGVTVGVPSYMDDGISGDEGAGIELRQNPRAPD